MKPSSIIDVFQEPRHCRSDMIEIAVSRGIDLLLLQGLHEALRHGVVVRTTWPAHAGQNALLLEFGDIVEASILDTAIRVMDQSASGDGTISECHAQRLKGERRPEMIVQRPADDLS